MRSVIVDLEIMDELQSRAKGDLIQEVALASLRAEPALASLDESQELLVDISIVDDETIQGLNAAHRGLNEPTDVLSFPALSFDENDRMFTPPGLPVHLGDIVISLPRAEEQALEYGHSVERELAYLCVHGLLHLAGYDHESEEQKRTMRTREEEILATVSLSRQDD